MTHKPRFPVIALAIFVAAALVVALPAAASARSLYVTKGGGGPGAVSVLNTANDTFALASIPVGALPLGAAITPDGSRAYVTGSGLGGSCPDPGPCGTTVTAIDTSTNLAIGGPITVGDAPMGIAITPDGTRAYVANLFGGGVSVIDTDPSSPTYNTRIQTISPPGMPVGVAITPDGSRAYVTVATGPGTEGVAKLDVEPSSPTYNTFVGSTLDLGGGVGFVTISGITPDGSKLYMPFAVSNSVKVVNTNPSSGSYGTVTTIPDVASPFMVAVSPDGSHAYVTSGGTIFGGPPGPGTVAVIDTSAGTATGSAIPTGSGSLGVAFTPDGGHAYVVNALSSTVSDVNTVSGSSTAIPLAGGFLPLLAAMTPDQGPTASFTASAGDVDTPASFNATASSDPDGSVARYNWDFGDGSTTSTTTPTTTHAYSAAGTYTATLTVTDNEGCSDQLIYTGQTASCNGSSAARKSIDVAVTTSATTTASPSPCWSSASSPPASVSHWQSVGGPLLARIRTFPGGHSRRSGAPSLFTLQTSRSHRSGQRAPGKSEFIVVQFMLDGQPLKIDTVAPYTVSIDPRTLAEGAHTIKADVYSRRGGKRAVSFAFEVCDFEAAAFSAGMSTKQRRAHPALTLRARTDGAELKRATFTLPRNLRLRTKGLKGKSVGVAELIGETGKKTKRVLRLGPRVLGEAVLTQSAKLTAYLNLRKSRPTISIRNLAGTGATGIQIRGLGGSTRMFRNPRACGALDFSATLTTTSGEPKMLRRSLKMCKGSS